MKYLWIPSASGQGGHVQHAAYFFSAAGDVGAAVQFTRLSVVGSQADQGGDLMAIELAQFGQMRQEHSAGLRADARGAAQDGFFVAEVIVGLDVVLDEIESQDDLVLAQDEGPPRICTPDGVVQTVHGGDGISMFKMLSSLVDSYVGRWKLNRVIDPDLENVAWRYPDWSAVIEFPALTIEDVMKAAIDEDPVPAGMTRFVVPERALRINAELSLLRRPGSELEKQELLDRLLEERARAGRIRRYDEAVVILDD